VADLLECVIQIKALAHTRDRLLQVLAALVPGSAEARSAAPLIQELVAAERRYAEALRPGTAACVAPTDGPAAISQFGALRTATLETLAACSGDQLAAAVTWPGRPRTTVADLVAVMLAHDTDVIGEVRGLTLGPPRR